MEYDADHFEDREKRFAALMVGGAMITAAAASLLTGPLSMIAFVIGGSLLGFAVSDLIQAVSKEDGITSTWPRDKRPAEPSPAIVLDVEMPQADQFWRERVEHAADAQTAERGR
jgi:hypothetical protein